jgi:phosphoribosyl 1,2-cyclic phosphodiesterase
MPLKIKTYASGSHGNLYRITDRKTTLMLECGLRFREIRQAFNFKLSEVDGCLVSHAHADHSKAVKDVMAAGIDCYMSAGTADRLSLKSHRIKAISHLKKFTINSFQILPFSVKHDCAEPMGFLIQSGSEKLVFMTDSFFCPYRFTGITHWMIESNYCKEILEKNIESGFTSSAIKSRLEKSHFEFSRVKEFFMAQDTSRTREIHLIHVSRGNGDPERFKSEIEGITGVPVCVATGKGRLT